MNFLALQNEVKTFLANASNITSAETVSLKRWINDSYRDIVEAAHWQFLELASTFTTVAKYNTGTISISGTTVTGVGTTFTAAMVGRYLQVEDDNNWYEITAFTSTTEITIGTSYVGTASGADYNIVQQFAELASDVDVIETIVCRETGTTLYNRSRSSYEEANPIQDKTGYPHTAVVEGESSNGYVQVKLVPFPTGAKLYDYTYYKLVSDMSDDSDEPDIPARWHRVIIRGAIVYALGWEASDISMVQLSRDRYQEALDKMKQANRRTAETPAAYGNVWGAEKPFSGGRIQTIGGGVAFRT